MADLKRVFFVLSFKRKPRVYIETGTYNGDNLSRRLNSYDKLYSIEINPEFQANNIQKYESIDKVNLFVGDSATILPRLLNDISEPCVIYLDAHYSGKKFSFEIPPMPLIHEIESISEFKFNSITVIDDIRLLGKKSQEGLLGDPLYPLFTADWSGVTMEEILEKIPKKMRTFKNNCGSITTGRTDQLIIAHVSGVSNILLNIYIYLIYPLFFYYQLKLYKKIIKTLRAHKTIHGFLKNIKSFVLNFK